MPPDFHPPSGGAPSCAPGPQSAEARLHLALEAAGVGTWVWEITEDILTWDEITHRLFGVTAGEFRVGRDTMEGLIHPDDREPVRAEVARSVAACEEFDIEFRVVWPGDRSVHYLRSRGRTYRGEGEGLRLTGTSWEITRRKQVEAELAHERFLLKTLMENMPDKIYFKDAQSRFLRVSHAMARFFGVSDESQVLGKTDFDFFGDEHARCAFEDERRILETGTPLLNQDEREIWPDGSETWVATTKLPLRDAEGRIVGTFGISRDLTARRRAEQQLAAYAEELRTRNRELEEDLEMARELQSALMPKRYPCFPHDAPPGESALRFSHFFNPSMAVSGDFFDILPLSDTTAAIFICDVMGHGMRAALVAALVRALVGELKGIAHEPEIFLGHLNRKLCAILKGAETPMFASAAYVVADLTRRELRYANAGHPAPLQLHRNGHGSKTIPLKQGRPGPVLGMFAGAEYGACRTGLSLHDVVLLFTDGLFEVEGTGGELYDQEALIRAIDRRGSLCADELCREVMNEIQEFSPLKQFGDDVCLVAVEVERLVAGQ